MSILTSQQNLIPNPDFEEYYDCEFGMASYLNDVIPFWKPRVTTPRYFNTFCSIPPHQPYNGNGFIYLLTVDNASADDGGNQIRNYVQVETLQPLLEGKNYYLEYYVQQTYSPESAHSHHGILFSNQLVIDVTFPITPPFYPLLLEPQLEIDTIVEAFGFWKKISFCYTPDQDYSVLTVGTFQPRDSIQRNTPILYGLYSYDAFYLIEIPDTLQLVSTPTRDTICAGECVTFSSNHSRVPGDFLWDLPGSDLSSAADSVVTVCYDQPGTYAVGLSTDHCHGTYSRTWPEAVVVLPRPSQTGGAAQTYRLLRGESLPLEICDNSLDWTVNWSPAAGLSCTDCPDPVYGGTESVQLTAVISLGGACPDTCRYTIEVVDGAAAAFSAEEPSICAGECFRFQNNSTAATRPIRFGPADDLREVPAGRPMLEYCPPEAGTYELLFIVGGELNSDTFIISGLVARSAPVPVAVQRDFSTTVDDLLALFPGFEAETYRWQVAFRQSGTGLPRLPPRRRDALRERDRPTHRRQRCLFGQPALPNRSGPPTGPDLPAQCVLPQCRRHQRYLPRLRPLL